MRWISASVRMIGISLMLVTTLTIGSPVISTQVTDEYNCLWLATGSEYYREVGTGSLMINLASGEQIKSAPLPQFYPTKRALGQPYYYFSAFTYYLSPNSHYVVKWGGPDNLFLQSAGQEELYMIQRGGYPGDMRVGQGSAPSPFPAPFPVQWSSDSQRLAYVWRGVEKYYVTIFNVETRLKEFTAEADGELALWVAKPGWSADNRYYAFQGFGKDGPALQLWSVEDSAIVQSIPGVRVASTWSPDHYLAYVRDGDNQGEHWLGFASASTTSAELLIQHHRPYFNGIISSDWSSRWSPDGQYLALRSNGISHGMDLGSSLLLFSRTAQITPNIEGIIGQAAVWGPDGRSLVFLQMRGGDVTVRDLIYYPIEGDTGAPRILLQNVHMFFPGPTKLAAIQILENEGTDSPTSQAFVMDYDGTNSKNLHFDHPTTLGWVEEYLVGFFPKDDNRILVTWIDPQNQRHQIMAPFQPSDRDFYRTDGARVILIGPGRPSSLYLLDFRIGTLSLLDGWPTWSPDGSRLAYIDAKTVVILETATFREVERITTGLSITRIDWISCPG